MERRLFALFALASCDAAEVCDEGTIDPECAEANVPGKGDEDVAVHEVAMVDLTGTIETSPEFIDFKVKLGTSGAQYLIEGRERQVSSWAGYYKELGYGNTLVHKQSGVDPTLTKTRLANRGRTWRYPLERQLDGVVLVGVPMSGKYELQYWESKMSFEGLTVGDAPSRGHFAMKNREGRVDFEASVPCAFGDAAIHSTAVDSAVILADAGSGRWAVSLAFGGLHVAGLVVLKVSWDVDMFVILYLILL
jgi:hypothetical protein